MPLLKSGQPAPLFHLIDQRSHLVDLANALQQGPVLLLFYRRDFEPKTASILRQWKHWLETSKPDDSHLRRLQVIAISSDEWERHHQFANQLALPFPVLYDHLGKVAKRYGCQIIPVLWSREASFLIENQSSASDSKRMEAKKEAHILQSFSGLITPTTINSLQEDNLLKHPDPE
jgi:peroxiredoxin